MARDEPDGRATRTRFVLAGWLAGAAALAYLCRNSLAVAEKAIRLDLGLSEEAMGLVLGPAFFWTYALGQLPGGWCGTRFGARRALPVFAAIWSLATALTGCAGGIVLLWITRMGNGLAQAGAIPCCVQSISEWHPRTERALASGLFTAAMSIGAAVGAGLTGLLLSVVDWRAIFVLFALPGLAWSLGFHRWFRDLPEDHPQVGAAELALIRGPRNKGTAAAESAGAAAAWRTALQPAARWLYAQQFFRAAGTIFFGSWFATYLQETRGVSTQASGLLTMLPLIATVAAAAIGGGLSDRVLRVTGRLSLARQGVAVVSLALCVVIVGLAYFVTDAGLATAVISLGVFCAGLAGPCSYAASMDVGGHHVAAVFGTMNMVGNFGAGTFPWLVPHFKQWIEARSGVVAFFGGNSWNAVLWLFAATYLAAAACWLVVQIEERKEA